MKRREFLKLSAVSVGGAITLTTLPGQVLAQTSQRLKYDSYVTEHASPSVLDRWFLDELVKRTNGEIEIQYYWAQSLNKAGAHLKAIKNNISEISLIAPGYYQSDLPTTRGLEWYYKMNRADALLKVCRDVYDEYTPLRQEWESRHKAKVLYWTNWYYCPLITREPINSIEDLKGKRIRGYGVGTDVVEKLGGRAIPMAAPEVYSALERGVLDGAFGFDFITAISYGLHEAAPYITEIGSGPHAPSATVIGIDAWNALPDDIKAVVNELTQEIYQHKYHDIYSDIAENRVRKAMNEGARFSQWEAAEIEAARKRVQPTQVNDWVDNVAGKAGIDGHAMQSIITTAIQRHDADGRLKTPYEIYTGLA
ncbi:TRAP transporter substrate-binding protein DctP [Marinobacterium marinum]|uniref:TRAP transporter substrate-binding protein DctP n=1 Tax=Marinobacterium marinum TaxID=2756129 RepID=A0A7W1WWV8_9GAMM|nr:TRAP transporter substrate-binding protein DctP [Marinobacterium marinum]MBA4501676.1 TRAP transporter substrate-binding protein DctP [Marinobacterium marinum]